MKKNSRIRIHTKKECGFTVLVCMLSFDLSYLYPLNFRKWGCPGSTRPDRNPCNESWIVNRAAPQYSQSLKRRKTTPSFYCYAGLHHKVNNYLYRGKGNHRYRLPLSWSSKDTSKSCNLPIEALNGFQWEHFTWVHILSSHKLGGFKNMHVLLQKRRPNTQRMLTGELQNGKFQ